MGSENMVMVRLLQIGAKDLTVTSQSQMSNIFRDSESIGKSNGKKWSQNKKKNTNRGCKIAAHKNLFFSANLGVISY